MDNNAWLVFNKNNLGNGVLAASPSRAKPVPELAEYAKLYSLINRLLQTEMLDFKTLAETVGLKEAPLQEILRLRLVLYHMSHQLGHPEGICYGCGNKLEDLIGHEPLCLPCLSQMAQAAQHLHDFKENEPHSNEPKDLATASAALTVPKPQYDALLHEVALYREKYGQLIPDHEHPPENEPPSIPSDASLLVNPLEQNLVAKPEADEPLPHLPMEAPEKSNPEEYPHSDNAIKRVLIKDCLL